MASLRERIGRALVLAPAVAAVVRDARGCVLVQTRTDTGVEELPAGSIDPGEAPAQALVREVFEETGLRVRPTRLLGIYGGEGFRYTYPNGDVVEYTVAFFECVVVGGSLAPRDGEATDARFVPPEQAVGIAGERLRLLERALREGGSGAFDWDERWIPSDR